jgi:YD repeat-containing protein
LSESDNGSSTNYTYDATGQLIGAGALAYTYDANGNRTMAGYVTGPGNRLLSDGTWTYSYDPDGNMIGKVDAAGDKWAYTYDARDEMTGAAEYDPSGNLVLQATYAYDALGNRISSTTIPMAQDRRLQ